MTKIICGFSGTLKSGIIDIEWDGANVLESPTKFWNNFSDDYCDSCLDAGPIHSIALRLFTLEHMDRDNLVIERSIYDYVFFSILFKYPYFSNISDFQIDDLVTYEKDLIGEPQYYIIENQASEFIKKYVIGSDNTRNDVYSNVDTYMRLQSQYLKFIKIYIKSYKSLILTDDLAQKIIDGEVKHIDWK